MYHERNRQGRNQTGNVGRYYFKKDQQTGVLTEGIVKNVLTSAPNHHRGIKVRLEDGGVRRVQEILEKEED